MKKEEQHLIIEVGGKHLPLTVVRESRRSIRASIGKKAVILRVPNHPLVSINIKQEIAKVKTWLLQVDEQRSGALDRLAVRTYKSGDVLTVGERQYRLQVTTEDRKTHAGRLHKDGTIALQLAATDQGVNLQQNIRTLLSRIVAQDYLPAIRQRVREINDQHFQQKIHSVRLRYNHSRWGSCSSNGNINLSSRLLFAPQDVVDYVIVHELAHTIEMNHSPAFWQIVSRIMPDYRKKERWLKENSYLCDF